MGFFFIFQDWNGKDVFNNTETEKMRVVLQGRNGKMGFFYNTKTEKSEIFYNTKRKDGIILLS